MLGLGFRLRPATPGWGVGVCVCLVRAPLVPRHSWLGCAVWACVFGLGLWLLPATLGWGVGVCMFVCALRLYPTTPGRGVRCGCVCLGSGFGCAPPLLAGVLGCVCVCVRTPLLPRHSWLGCAVWVRGLGLEFGLRPATCGWGVGLCVCLCGRSPFAPPLLAGVCAVGVCAWARVSAAPRHSWPGCWGVCVCLCACSACTPPLLAGVRGVGGCAWALVSAAPRHSWLGCWGVCVCLCACSACTPPLLAGVCGVGVCVWARVSAAPRHSWLRFLVCGFGVAWHLSLCRGSLRVVRAARVCGTRWPLLLGTCPCVLVVAGGVPLWRAWWPRFCAPRLVRSGRTLCSGRLSRRRGAVSHPGGLRPRLSWVAARGTRRPAENRAHCACRWPPPWLGRWARSASYPFGAPRWGCPWRVPPASVLGCVRCGGWRVWTRSLTRPVSRTVRLSTGDSAGAPGLFLADADTAPFGSEDATPASRACVRVRVPLGRVGQAGLPGALWCASPFPGDGLAALFVFSAPSGLGSPFFFCAPRSSPAFLVFGLGLPALGVLPPPPLFFSPSSFFFSLCAPLLSLAFRVFWPRVPWALASSCLLLTPPFFFLFFLAPFVPPPLASFFFFAFFTLCAPVVSCVPCFPARGALGLGVFLSPPPPPFSFFFSAFPRYFFSSSPGFFFAPPLSLAFRVFRPEVPWALAPCCRPRPPPCCFFLPVCFLLFVFFSSSVPCRWCGAGLVCVPWAVGCAGVCFGGAVPVVALCAVLSRPSGAGWCCVVLPVVFGCLLLGLAVLRCLLVGPGVVFRLCCPCLAAWLAPCGLVWCVLVLRCPVLCSVALCCCVVVCCRALLFVCVVACACCLFPAAGGLLCVFWGPVLCVPCPLHPVRCCAALCWCPFVVLSAWSALFLVLGAVGSWCRCVFLGVRWWLWLPGVVVWWCVSALVSVSGRVSRRSASSLWCPVPLCCVLWRCAAVWCRAVVPCRLFVPFFFVPCLWRWLSVSPKQFPVKPVKMVFRLKIN